MKIPFLIIAIMASACSSLPKFSQSQSAVGPLRPGFGRVFFYRNTYMGAALSPDIKLNGQVIGESKVGRVFYRDLVPGDYTVETTTETTNSVALKVEKNQKKYVRFGVSLGFFVGHVYPELIAPDEGEREIQDLGFEVVSDGASR